MTRRQTAEPVARAIPVCYARKVFARPEFRIRRATYLLSPPRGIDRSGGDVKMIAAASLHALASSRGLLNPPSRRSFSRAVPECARSQRIAGTPYHLQPHLCPRAAF